MHPSLAVIIVMSVITCLMSLVTVLCWHQNISSIIGFIFFSGVIEAFYFSAFLIKFLEGAWISKPLLNMHVGMDSKVNFQVSSQSEIMGQPNERPNEDELPHELPEINLRIRRGV